MQVCGAADDFDFAMSEAHCVRNRFGMDGVRGAVKGLGATNARTLVETILRAVEKHATGNPPFDDITILAVRRTA